MKVRRYAGILSLLSFSTGLLASVLSLVMLSKGISLGGIALAMGIYSVTAAALEVPSGVAADLLGRRLTFVVSLILSAAAYALMLFLRGPWLMAAVALAGAGRAMASGTVEALFLSRHNAAYGADRLPKAMRVLALTESAGLAAGALLGSFLPAISAALLPGWGAYDLNLLLRAAMCPLIAGLTLLWIPSDKGERPERVRLSVHLRESARVVWRSRSLKWLLLAAVGLGVALCALEAYWQPLFLGLLGGSRIGLLGVLSVLYFGAVTAGNLVSEKLLSRHKVREKTMYLAGRFGMLACMVGAALIPQPAVFMALYCLMYFCLGASNISEGALIHREVPDERRASMLSVQSFMLQAGVLAASAGAGAAAGTVSIPVIWLAAAAAAALLLAPAIRIAVRRRPEKRAEHENPPQDIPCDGEESTQT